MSKIYVVKELVIKDAIADCRVEFASESSEKCELKFNYIKENFEKILHDRFNIESTEGFVFTGTPIFCEAKKEVDGRVECLVRYESTWQTLD